MYDRIKGTVGNGRRRDRKSVTKVVRGGAESKDDSPQEQPSKQKLRQTARYVYAFFLGSNSNIHPLSDVDIRNVFYFHFFHDVYSAPINEIVLVVLVCESCSLQGVNMESPRGIRTLMNEPGNAVLQLSIPVNLNQDLIEYIVNSPEFKAKVI